MISFLIDFGRILAPLLGHILKKKTIFWEIIEVYKLESDFVSILGSKFDSFLDDFWLFFWNVFYMSCVSANVRECTFYPGKT